MQKYSKGYFYLYALNYVPLIRTTTTPEQVGCYTRTLASGYPMILYALAKHF